MYDVGVHQLAEHVLEHIRQEELLRAGDRVGVAVSGGIDSVALLRLLIKLRQELGIVLSMVHFNHRLRGAESDADQEFAAELAREYGLEFYVGGGDVAQQAADQGAGMEAIARELRYGFFRSLLGSGEGFEPEAVSPQPSTLGSTSGAEAQGLESVYRSAESAAPPKGAPQGLKPEPTGLLIGTAEAVPFPMPIAPPASQVTLTKIATGHTLDDQAETVLMRLIRGTGLRGLGGIYPRIAVEHEDGESHGEIIRPLLRVRRRELEQYLADVKQPWREDSSNADSRFTRNRVRKLVVPLLEREFNPAVVESFAELAEIARDEEDYWENEISGWLGTVVQWSEPEWLRKMQDFDNSQGLVQIGSSNSPGVKEPEDKPETDPTSVTGTPCGASDGASGHGLLRFAQDDGDLGLDAPWLVRNASVSRPWLLTEPRAVQRRVLKAIGEQAGIPLEFKHVEEILRFAAEEGPAGKELSLPLGWKIIREPEAMVFVTPDLRRAEPVADYEYSLAVPGRAVVPEVEGVIEALRVAPGSPLAEYNSEQLLRADLLPVRLMVRNWRPGDRFWPAHTRAPKKVKELLQERHITQPERRLWPVAVSGDEIVWMRGFPVPARLRAQAGEEAVLIRETPWAVDEGAI
jgi:tRNA(Ile)-lysidine synthetase-like protein